MAKNLLVIISDEHRKDAMGHLGHPIVKTPNLDAFAKQGTVFTSAYTPSPMCVPTRASIATGRYVHETGHWDSATPYDGKIPSWMHRLRNAGHEVVSIGKLHFRSADDDNGFSKEILPMHVVGGVGWAVGLLRDNPPRYDAAAELAEQVGRGESTYTAYDREITDCAVDWLTNEANTDAPWAAFVSMVSPHYPLIAPDEFYDLYDPATVDLPIGYGEAQQVDHAELKNIVDFFAYEKHFDEQTMRRAKCAYYGLVSFMDHNVGRVLAALEASGQADDTIVIYCSDHGEMLGDQGFWTKQVMYEQSAGVPLIVRGGEIGSCRTPVNLIDIAATAYDVAGLDADSDSMGRSLLVTAGKPDDLDRSGFSEYHDGGSRTGTFMVRWGDWKYVHYVGQRPQLFQLSSDPNEQRDLSAENTEEVVAALREGERRLRAICDPNDVNKRCFEDQEARIEELGGRQACQEAYVFNHTPTPSEQEGLAL